MHEYLTDLPNIESRNELAMKKSQLGDSPSRIIQKPDEVYIGLSAKSEALLAEDSGKQTMDLIRPLVTSNATKAAIERAMDRKTSVALVKSSIKMEKSKSLTSLGEISRLESLRDASGPLLPRIDQRRNQFQSQM